MLSLQFPTAVSPLSRSFSRHTNDKPLSSLKLSSIAGNRTAEGASHDYCCYSPAASSIPRSRLTAADGGMNDEETAIQFPGELRPQLMPKHVALILDGNGRWARSRGLPIQHGHRAGSINLRRVISTCCKLGVKVLTAFLFSTENWKRSTMEVEFLMRIIEDFIRNDVQQLIERHNIQFSAIGDRSRLPGYLQSAISGAEEASKDNRGMHFVCALSYSGQYDIIEATKKIASKVEEGILRAHDIDCALFEQHLTTNLMEFPNPDFLIRTSGELRASNFMLWQLAYTEFYFSDKAFPDFGEPDLIQAFTSFQHRQRRFGERVN